MFTGLIREVGRVGALARKGDEAEITVLCGPTLEGARVGDSIAVDGACLTIDRLVGGGFSAYLSAETLRKTTLGELHRGEAANLEASLRASDRLGGHLVQGHVEGVGTVASFEKSGRGAVLAVEIPSDLAPYVIPKGSIAFAGVSLTVASLSSGRVEVAVVPATLEGTTVGAWRAGRRVNVETDLAGRYIVSYLRGLRTGRGLSVEDLIQKGF